MDRILLGEAIVHRIIGRPTADVVNDAFGGWLDPALQQLSIECLDV